MREGKVPGLNRFQANVCWRIVRESVQVYVKNECGFRAASLAYHLLLSLFPLLLLLLALGSRLLSSEVVRQSLRDYLGVILPVTASSVDRVLEQSLSVRGSVGFIGALLLLWSATAVFNSLSSTLNVIWGAKPRALWRQRMFSIIAVLTIAVLFIASIWLVALSAWPWPGKGGLFWGLFGVGVDFGVSVLLFWLAFRLFPNRPIPARASLAGAILAGFLWNMAKTGFAWFLSSGLTSYGLVYGSLASVVSLMLWTYLSGVIVFIGAVFGSVLERHVWQT